ncbi:patatin-like phospholipase family protein [Devosia sp. A8/3-2]|nr:patatin-like phospholipase family protein [Devosia sp. A8/3-2]
MSTAAGPRIGVALGGGSARGLTHIPYIEAMDELGLKPSVISGTSIGALIGAGWAAGMTGAELREHSFKVLGTMKIIATKLWAAQIRGISGILKNGISMQLDATHVVDAFTPAYFPASSRTSRSRSMWWRPISSPGTESCSIPACCAPPLPAQSLFPASSGRWSMPITSRSMAAWSIRCRSTEPISTPIS